MLKKTLRSILTTLLIVVATLFISMVLLRTLISMMLDGPTVVIKNDSRETYEAVVAMYTYDNPSWLIKLGPSTFSPEQVVKINAGAAGFSCLYLFKDSSNIPAHAYAAPSPPDEVIEHTFPPNENVYLLSHFSEPCPLGSFLPTFKFSGPL